MNKKSVLFVALSILCINFTSCGAVEIEPKKEITKRGDVSLSDSFPNNSSAEVSDSGAANEIDISNKSVNVTSFKGSKTTTTKKKKKVKQTESSSSADENNAAVATIIPSSENNNSGNDSMAVTTIPDQDVIENLQSSLPITFESEGTTVQNPNPYGLSADEYLYEEILDKYIQTMNSGGNSMTFYTSTYDPYWNPNAEQQSKTYHMYGNNEKKTIGNLGYTFVDINSDGTNELIVSFLSVPEQGVLVDCFTIKNGKPEMIKSTGDGSSGWTYHLLKDSSISYFVKNGVADLYITRLWINTDFSEIDQTMRCFYNGSDYEYSMTNSYNPYRNDAVYNVISQEQYNTEYGIAMDYLYLDLKSFTEYKK